MLQNVTIPITGDVEGDDTYDILPQPEYRQYCVLAQ